jgi:hypothetical protein
VSLPNCGACGGAVVSGVGVGVGASGIGERGFANGGGGVEKV